MKNKLKILTLASIGILPMLTSASIMTSCSNAKFKYIFEADDHYEVENLGETTEKVYNSEGKYVFDKVTVKYKFTEKAKWNNKPIHKPLTIDNFKARTWYDDGSYSGLYHPVYKNDATCENNILSYTYDKTSSLQKLILTMGGFEISDDITTEDFVGMANLGAEKCQKYFALGDVKTIKFNGFDHKVGIVGFGVDDILSTNTKAAMTLEFVDPLIESKGSYGKNIYLTDWNSSENNKSYTTSTVFNLLESVKSKIDPVILSNMKTVNRQVLEHNGSWQAKTYASNFFLPSISNVALASKLEETAEKFKVDGGDKKIFSLEGKVYPWYESERFLLSQDVTSSYTGYWKTWKKSDYYSTNPSGAWYQTPVPCTSGTYKNRVALSGFTGTDGIGCNHVKPTGPLPNIKVDGHSCGAIRPWFCL